MKLTVRQLKRLIREARHTDQQIVIALDGYLDSQTDDENTHASKSKIADGAIDWLVKRFNMPRNKAEDWWDYAYSHYFVPGEPIQITLQPADPSLTPATVEKERIALNSELKQVLNSKNMVKLDTFINKIKKKSPRLVDRIWVIPAKNSMSKVKTKSFFGTLQPPHWHKETAMKEFDGLFRDLRGYDD